MFNIILLVMFCMILKQMNLIQKEQANHARRLDTIEDRLYIKRKRFEEFKAHIEETDDRYPRLDELPTCNEAEITERDYEIDKQLNNIDFRHVIGKFKVEEVLNNVNNLSFPS